MEITSLKTVQLEEYSTGGGADDIFYISAVWQSNVPYVNGNGGNRNLNLYTVKNDWNENYEFAAVRKQLYFLRYPEVFKSFCHIPIILPIFARGVER